MKTDNEGKSVVSEKIYQNFIKKKNYKYITSISKNVYIDKQDDMVNEYNNAYHKTIQPNPVGVEDNT